MRTTTKLRLADGLRWGLGVVERCGVRLPSVVERGGIRWPIDWHEAIDLAIATTGAFDRPVQRALRRRLRPGAVVYDIGANRGAIALPMARSVGEHGAVHAFEATADAVAALQRTLALNPSLAPRVRVHHVFLSDGASPPAGVDASWPVGRPRDPEAPHGGRRRPLGDAEVESLDERVRRLGLPPPDLVKLDVDGFEASVLAGAAELLRRHRPPIVLEIAPDAHDVVSAGGFESMLEVLRGLRYRLETTDGADLPVDDAGLRSRVARGSGIAAVAIPDAPAGVR